jgi:hypothetical protein
MIYMAGGSEWDGSTLLDSVDSYAYNPATDTIVDIADIPRATAETRAFNMGGQLWVLGGGRVLPNPSNLVDVYDPGTNTWSAGPPFVLARRNFMAASDGVNIVISGGYAPTSATDNTEVFRVSGNPCPTNTPTVGVPPTNTSTPPPSPTGPPPNTSTPTSPAGTATSTRTPCGEPCTLSFTDVPPSYTFYNNIQCLVCRGVISGYPCGGVNPETGQPEPCDGQQRPYFRPENRINRGQIAKLVDISQSYSNETCSAVIPPATGQTYEDVPPTETFYTWIERLSQQGVMGGYPCGTRPNEPCVPPGNRPYFRTYESATRAQVAKIVSNAAGFNEVIPPTQRTYEDVLPNSTFWVYIERLSNRSIISGVACGGINPETGQPEPCIPPDNRPYFRPNNSIKRGQTSKIVGNTFFPECGALRPETGSINQ